MRAIERTSQFERDYKRESRGRHGASLDVSSVPGFEALVQDVPLEHRYHDHQLSGKWADYRDNHLRPDLLLIYQKPDVDTLRLVRLESHSEPGL